ncbi:MAG: 3-deoxy-manno-octulosonate cytidylyltransferase [Planctomycetota bacterium]|nr:3-deoxy-manno-octulosonate cytidylyltransferase [Planctomycetota bacterium]
MPGPPVIGIIPARLGSTRFPGKVLADATGRPLIRHVVEAARRAPSLARIVVATDDDRVAHAVRSFGGECVLTSPDHPNGTSRLHEACARLSIPEAPGDEIIVNVQGDEPEIEPALIEAGIAALRAAPWGVDASTVALPISDPADAANPNVVKVVRRQDGAALYFSRSLIPFDRDNSGAAAPLRHVGLYVYRRRFLARYVTLAPTPLELAEKLEQLRALEHGLPMAVALPENAASLRAPAGIDTAEQYARFVERWNAPPR